MATRGLIAVTDGPSWKGFYRHWDCYPEGAGAELLGLLRKYGLEACGSRIAKATLMKNCRERATPDTFGDQGDLEWFYLLDVAGRSLRVFCQGPRATPDGPMGFKHASWLEVARLEVDTAGRCSPAILKVEIPAPWQQLAVLAQWPNDDRAATRRLDTRRRVARDAIAAGFTEAGFLDLLQFAVTEALLHAPWPTGSTATSPFYVIMPWAIDSSYLCLELGSLVLHYPADDWSRNGITAKLSLFASSSLVAELPLQRSTLLSHLPERQRVEGVFISALPSEAWLFAIFDLLRARSVGDPRGAELEALATPADQADDWRVFMHADGRMWSTRLSHGGFQLRLGAPDDDPVFKERVGTSAALEALIGEQRSDGFVEVTKTGPC